ncbi:MAG: tetratricopeptide repeat protein [Deltaproteobacteria bacterium]|nr:tetratricopeptide repeat protein [Deltaproteobacteria bacterium]
MMEKGEYLIAVGEFERFIQFFPHDRKIPEANFLIGVCYLKAKDYENARNVLQGTHSKYPDTEVGGKAPPTQERGALQACLGEDAFPQMEGGLPDL